MLYILKVHNEFSLEHSLLQADQSRLSQPHFIAEVFSSLIIFAALFWTHFKRFIFFLHCGHWRWLQYSSWSLTRAEKRTCLLPLIWCNPGCGWHLRLEEHTADSYPSFHSLVALVVLSVHSSSRLYWFWGFPWSRPRPCTWPCWTLWDSFGPISWLPLEPEQFLRGIYHWFLEQRNIHPLKIL